MRIALVSQEYPPQTAHGGIATQTRAKAHGLAARGHDVHVISHSVDEARHEYRDGEVRVTRIPGFDAHMPIRGEPARWVTWSALVAAELAALAAREGIELVDFPEWGAEGWVHLLNRADWARLPTVIHLQGPLVMLAHTIGWPDTDSELYRTGTFMEAACLRMADAVYSSSVCSARWCADHYGLDATTVPVIHSGVDTEVFRPLSTPRPERPSVLFVGRVAASKGAHSLLDAACIAARQVPGLRLRMVGRADPDFSRELLARASARGLPDLVELAGHLPREALPEAFSRAHLFAAPSRYEGGPGFVYLEAMACGLPVIACSGSGSAEVVSHGDTGLLVPPDDVDALARALLDLLLDAPCREAMGERARAWTVEHADSRLCVRRLEDFYRGVLEGRR